MYGFGRLQSARILMTCDCWSRERTSAFSSTLKSLTLQVKHHVAVTSTSTVLPSAMRPGSAAELNTCHSRSAAGCETGATADRLTTRGTIARPAVINPDQRDARAAIWPLTGALIKAR